MEIGEPVRTTRLASGLPAALARLVAFALAVCFAQEATAHDEPDQAPRSVGAEHHDSSPSRRAQLAALVSELDEWLDASALSGARTGIHVGSLHSGEEVYARGADRLLNPASNMKLVTAAAALEILGPHYRFKTEIFVDAPPDGAGVVNGNIYIKGYGDPSIVTERMFRLTLDLWNLGVRQVTGDVVIDDTFFDGVMEGPGWEQETGDRRDRAYVAPVAAVSLNRNAVAIHVRPGSREGEPAVITVDPGSPFFVIDNRVVTGSSRSRLGHRPSSIGEGNRQRILVRGVHPIDREPRVYWRRIDNPAHYFAHTFGAFMRQHGVRFTRWRIRTAPVPSRARLLHTTHSEQLSDLIGPLNKFSNNYVAEMLVKTMGAEARGVPGSWEKGGDAIAEFLAAIGIDRGSYVFRNGSGLNDVNRMSARQMTQILRYMWSRFQTSPEFVVSLPVSARDGTTRWRMEEASGWVRAKTGTLENVSALSGYVGLASGEVLTFSVLVNDYSGTLRSVIIGIDGVPVRLARFGGLPYERSPGPRVPTPAETTTDFEERVAIYLALGASRDPRNARFLVRAIETETDGLLRALAAEAAYRCSAAHGELLVESFRPSVVNLSRLKSLTLLPIDQLPVVGSLADLAADGNRGAMRLLLESARLGATDPALQPWFAEALTEVGRAAPDELLSVLIEMDSASEGDLIGVLAKGLRVDAEHAPHSGKHPIREAIRAMAGSGEKGQQGSPDAAAVEAIGERIESLLDVREASDVMGEGSSLDPGDAEARRAVEVPAAISATATPSTGGLR